MMRQQPPPHHAHTDSAVYAFDLKLNVDFNSRHLSVNVPSQVPFTKKVYVPVSNCPPGLSYSSAPQYIPLSHEPIAINQPQGPPKNHIIIAPQQYNEAHAESASQNIKNVETMNTTQYRLQPSPEAIQCVICQKVIRKQEFALHLEEHRNKRKDKSSSSARESQVSIRNKNPEAEFAEIINNQPQSLSLIPHSLNFSQSNIVYSNPHIPPQQKGSSFRHMQNEPIQYTNSPQMQQSRSYLAHPYQSSNSSQTSFNLSRSSMEEQQAMNNNSSLSSHSRIQMPLIDPTLHSINNQRPIIIHDFHPNHLPQERDLNTLHFHRIESMIIRPEPAKIERGLDDCGQSIISRNSIPTRYSEIYALQHQLQERKPNSFSQHDSSSSSDDESLKVYPSRSFRSGFTPEAELQRSTYTEKLSKTKLPVNYLAREEFISTSTQNSNSKKSKPSS